MGEGGSFTFLRSRLFPVEVSVISLCVMDTILPGKHSYF